MATLITQYTNGRRRSCNARCYNAKGSVCTCICEGHNHGVGLRQATENTQHKAEELLEVGVRLGSATNQLVMKL